jgi:hypothetical protein
MCAMNRLVRIGGLSLGAAAGATLSTGCAGTKQEQLEHVAKDWSLVIRASQVIPVYPLTEDVQPGDIFLVDRPIQQQHEQYLADGFLPLDTHVHRIQPSGYSEFYSGSFDVGNEERVVPKFWLQPGQGKEKAWLEAPQAGFPSYSFSVKRGGGFNAALPINGVPVGLTLLGTDAADGSITIDKARTYGVDMVSLYADVQDWAAGDSGRNFLSQNRSTPEQRRYLRIISRVYLTGRMIVQLNDTASNSAGVSVGAAKPVELLTAAPNADPKVATAEQYGANVEKINSLLEQSLQRVEVAGQSTLLPGATLKVVAASSRSITMAEDFIDRPLVIGYLGFDLLIGEDGQLGFPTATRDVLERAVEPQPLKFTQAQSSFIVVRKQIQDHPQRDELATRAAEIVGGGFLAGFNARAPDRTGYSAFVAQAAEFLEGEDGSGPRHSQLTAAMEQALREAGAH